jgi:micrococcal nuclease
MQKKTYMLILLFVFALLGISSTQQKELLSLVNQLQPSAEPSQTLAIQDTGTYLVTKIIDGDTIELENGKKVRYIGIDTPEMKGNECFAHEAREKNRQLVEGKRVKLAKDVSETDKYGRLLRFVYTEQGDFVNNILVRDGFASIASYPPDISKQELFRASMQEAMQQNRGLWAKGCKSP